jgi:hypothetical protein
MLDKTTEVLVDVLRQALASPGEQRLFKSGKLAGLFASRGGINGEAAAMALRDGLLEMVRTETKGKTTIEWVRFGPSAVYFLDDHESPVRAVDDLRAVLQANREAIPPWLDTMQRGLQSLSAQLAEEARAWTHRLDVLSSRVEEALRRTEAARAQIGNGEATGISWALEALGYLDRRRANGAPAPCPLPELFAALRLHHGDLSVAAFHDGLRRLREHHALQLLPCSGPAAEVPEPEYALLDGPMVLYYVSR